MKKVRKSILGSCLAAICIASFLTIYFSGHVVASPPLEEVRDAGAPEETLSEKQAILIPVSVGATEGVFSGDRNNLVRDSLGQLIEGKNNAFFDREKFAEEWITKNPQGLSLLFEYLTRSPDIQNIQVKTSFMHDKPKIVLERMAAIDLISDIATLDSHPSESNKAREVLAAFIEEEVELGSKPSVKKMLLAEKFEALVFLTEADPQLANQTLKKIEKPELRDMLREAVLAGLVGSGMSHKDALAYMK